MAHKLVQYLSDSKKELKKVTWPTKQQAFKNTMVVIGVSLSVAVLLGLLDLLFSFLVKLIV